MIRQATFFWVGFLLMACSQTQEYNANALARVGDVYLYQEDIAHLNLGEMLPADSAELVKNYIDNWIRQQVMLQYAADNVPSEKLDFTKQLEEYRNSLVLYTYESEYALQNLDTTIRPKDITQLYAQEMADFKLKDNIYRLRYFVADSTFKKADSLKLWMESPEISPSLEAYLSRYALQSHLIDSVWYSSEQLMPVLPKYVIQSMTPDNKKFQMISIDGYTYGIRLVEMALKETVAPLSYVREDVKNLLLYRRRGKLLDKFRQNVMEDATANGLYEIY